jgi:hypothetical protein
MLRNRIYKQGGTDCIEVLMRKMYAETEGPVADIKGDK